MTEEFGFRANQEFEVHGTYTSFSRSELNRLLWIFADPKSGKTSKMSLKGFFDSSSDLQKILDMPWPEGRAAKGLR